MWLERYSAFKDLGAVCDLYDFVSAAIENGIQQFPAIRRTICDQNSRFSRRPRILTATELIDFHPLKDRDIRERGQ